METETVRLVVLGLCAALLGGVAAADEGITLHPAIVVKKADYESLLRVNQLLQERQHLVELILNKYELKRVKPVVPKYGKMSENSVQALLNQLDFTALAEKVGAELPAPPSLPSGPPFENNLFLHSHNQAILRSIGTKLGVELPPLPSDPKASLEEKCFAIVHANNEILHRIAVKLGLV